MPHYEGPEQAKLAFVGEAPGKYEELKGRPFVGSSGKLLNSVLEHYGINREDVYLTNVVTRRPRNNATPSRADVENNRPRLIEELESRGVETVVALGNTAALALLGKQRITSLRVGPPKESPYLRGARVVPTIHPAGCLRNPANFNHLVTDVGKALHEGHKWDDPTYAVPTTPEQAHEYLDVLNDTEHLVIDIEVGIEKDTDFGHPDRYEMLCVGVGYAPGKVVVFTGDMLNNDEVGTRLGDILKSSKLIAHNGKFDLAGLYPMFGPLTLWFDTMLASYVDNENPGVHGLKYLSVEYLGTPQYDDEIKEYLKQSKSKNFANIPPDSLHKYNATDVATTYALWLRYENLFANDESGTRMRDLHDYLVGASNELMFMELAGISIDTDYLHSLGTSMSNRLREIESQLPDPELNPRSPKQIKEYLLENKIEVGSTDEETIRFLLDNYRERVGPEVAGFCDSLLEHRRVSKMHGTYVKGIEKRLYKGKVHPSFLLHGTTTGRLSCRNPNIQNIPRESGIRSIFVPQSPDHVFLNVDYSQAELRVLSFLSNDTYFRDILNDEKRDIFSELIPVLYPEAQRPTENASDAEKADWKEKRVMVKSYVYGLAYGRTEHGIVRAHPNLTISEAREGMERFFAVIPDITAFQSEVKNKVLNGEDLITPYGRRRQFPLITKENVKEVMNEAMAFLPQSTASDMTVSAMMELGPQLRLNNIGVIRNIIHDALLVECHRDNLEQVREMTENAMLNSGKRLVGDHVRIAVDSTHGNSWGEV